MSSCLDAGSGGHPRFASYLRLGLCFVLKIHPAAGMSESSETETLDSTNIIDRISTTRFM